MVVFPPCKINLGLNVVAKRPDGYHDIETCFYPVPWTDLLEVLPAADLKMEVSGISIPGDTNQNICLKAYHLLAADHRIPPVQIFLHKLIPTGAGLGGGSADGAYMLVALNKLFDLKIPQVQLKSYAAQLGSDCSFFIEGVPALGTGRGEQLQPAAVNLSGKFLVIIKPDIHVSTAAAYSGVVPGAWPVTVKAIVESEPVEKWKDCLKNDFEETVFEKYPEIRTIKDSLYQEGAIYAAMSGSGASVFGIFNSSSILNLSGLGTGWSGWV